MNKLFDQLGNMQSNFEKELRELLKRIEKCEKLGAENSKELEILGKKFSTELSKYHYKQEEKIPYVFDAPDRNRYFSGRTRELQELQAILKPDDTGQEAKACIGAVCGLGGIGKTSLVTEYAHEMKKYYRGGVYWFSAEDDQFFERSVSDTALKLGALLGTFDLTLTNTLIRIGQSSEPCLIVLDCLDQLDLSPNILKFLSIVSRQSVSGAVVVMTRRNESLLVEEISSFHKDRCLTLKCLEVEEAEEFLFRRTGLLRDENTNSVAKNLVEELGGLPLALEQAGACIKALRCSFPDYLEQYKTKRVQLLERQKAKPVSVYESPERLAVHTTWLLNISHIKESPDGMSAIRLMNAYAFLNPNEIEEELVNVGEPPIDDEEFRDCVSSRFGCHQVVKLLTDFSLFMYVHAHSVSTHRLVQELVRENLDPDEKAKGFVDAARLLSFAFSKCTSPKNLLCNVGVEERLKLFDFRRNSSEYFLWSKLCFHGFHLQQNMEKFLANPEPKCLDSLFVFETAKILYECVVHLSADKKQRKAKRTLNIVYRILDWVPLSDYDTIERSLSGNSMFPAHVIPLPKSLQIVIKQSCVPPMRSLEPLDEKPSDQAEGSDSRELAQKVEKLRLGGNKSYKDGHYKEAVGAYSTAINMSRGTPAFDPLLLTNRASAYIKLNQRDGALKDANEYISRFPDCWKGYARKASALDEKVSAEIAAALAYYYCRLNDGSCIFSEYQPFKAAFPGLKERICICDTVNQLKTVLVSRDVQDCLRIIIMGSKEYIINSNSGMPSIVSYEGNETLTLIIVRNCIMVGAKSDGSVNIKLEDSICLELLGNCMLANLSFSIDKGQIYGLPESFVKVLNCNFTSNHTKNAAVVSQGTFNAERCNFTNCKAVGLLCVGPSDMVVDDCTFARNVKAGLEVRENGILSVRKSRIYYNSCDGLAIGPRAAKCDVYDCQIYHNAREGIAALDASKCVKLIRNHVFGNYENGIFVRNSDVDIRENKFYDNEVWGIWSQTNSWCNVSMNEVFRNKRGGVRVGKRIARKEFPPSVVTLNTIHDNYGPGYIDNINLFDFSPVFFNLELLKRSDNYKSANFVENQVYNNEERIIVDQSKLSSSWCSGCFGKCEELKQCGKCFTAAYCNKNCQKRHWSKHKKLCKVLREKSSFLITSMSRHGFPDSATVNVHAKGLDEVGPKYSPLPPRDGKRFIVKVQTDFESIVYGKRFMLLIYDRSLDVYEDFQAEFIDNLVKNFGVLCERKYQEKKLFLYCVFEENGKLRLFTNDFANFQTW
jgi:parallel beta-helix repeat protein